MLSVFEPIRSNLIGRDFNAEEMIQVLQAKLNPRIEIGSRHD